MSMVTSKPAPENYVLRRSAQELAGPIVRRVTRTSESCSLAGWCW